jgi:hypothetical protein
LKIEIVANGLVKATGRATAAGNFDDLMTWGKKEAKRLGLKTYFFRFIREADTAGGLRAEELRFIQTRLA